jgi:hypothetical protein
MEKLIYLILAFFLATVSYGQATEACNQESLEKESNLKNAEPCVLIAADYILSQPLHGNEQKYYEYRKYILAWMEKTPDFTFALNANIIDICNDEENILLFGVYISCLAKAALEHKQSFDPEAIKLFVNSHLSKIK